MFPGWSGFFNLVYFGFCLVGSGFRLFLETFAWPALCGVGVGLQFFYCFTGTGFCYVNFDFWLVCSGFKWLSLFCQGISIFYVELISEPQNIKHHLLNFLPNYKLWSNTQLFFFKKSISQQHNFFLLLLQSLLYLFFSDYLLFLVWTYYVGVEVVGKIYHYIWSIWPETFLWQIKCIINFSQHHTYTRSLSSDSLPLDDVKFGAWLYN